MTKRLLATALSAALALTSVSATPVRAADSGEIGRFLLGAGALFIIGSAISNSHSNKRVTVQRHNHRPTHVAPRRKVVPAACIRHNRFDHGPRRFFGRKCLRNNMANVHRLPSHCLRTVWTNRGQRNVYGARCLRRSGWIFG